MKLPKNVDQITLALLFNKSCMALFTLVEHAAKQEHFNLALSA